MYIYDDYDILVPRMWLTYNNMLHKYVGYISKTISSIRNNLYRGKPYALMMKYIGIIPRITVQITFIFIDFRVCDFAFAFKTQNAPCVSRFKRVLFSDRFQFAF